MRTPRTSTGQGASPRSKIALPDGLKELAKRSEKTLSAELQARNLSLSYISVFHVEPRGSSFLVGFRVELMSGEEVFVYVEPDSRLGYPTPGANHPPTLWQYPFDPKLQALASVVNTEPLGIVFSRLNLGWVPSTVVLLTYRPGRRAVVRCSHGPETAFVKALRPQRAGRVIAAAQLARAAAVPTPRIMGWSPAGLAIYEPSRGTELSKGSVIGVTPSVAVNRAFEALSMLERVETQAASRRPIIDNASWYFSRAAIAHPPEKQALNELEQKIQAMTRRSTVARGLTTIHGDLHLGQLFVTRDKAHSLSGVIDLDDMGLGDHVDDVSAMWANCVASSHLSPLEYESKFWRDCTKALENWRLPKTTDLSRLHSSIAVHLVAQTLSTRGVDPRVANALIQEATAQVR